MLTRYVVAACACLVAAESFAACPVEKVPVETAIAKSPDLRGPNTQVARDMRTLRDAAVVLDALEQDGACKQVVSVLKKITDEPARALAAGDNDEERAEKIEASRKPKKPR
ncbi:MAG TPA: photosystem reaction center subunit H [Beijerinckiaceae bacterium]|jgi:hypothetical protein